jgi:hypothetical protein
LGQDDGVELLIFKRFWALLVPLRRGASQSL